MISFTPYFYPIYSFCPCFPLLALDGYIGSLEMLLGMPTLLLHCSNGFRKCTRLRRCALGAPAGRKAEEADGKVEELDVRGLRTVGVIVFRLLAQE